MHKICLSIVYFRYGSASFTGINTLKADDQVKFVICHRQDYDWAKFKVSEYDLDHRVSDVLFSPSWDQLDATELANWILEDGLPVRFQIRLHKILWVDRSGV